MAPTFRHGLGTRILANQYNLGGILNDASAEASVDTADTTVFGNQDKTYLAGLIDNTVSYKGFYDGAYSTAAMPRSRVQEVIQTALGSTSDVVNTYGPEGDTIGRRALLFNGLPSGLNFASPVSDAVKVEATQAMKSKMARGEWLKDFSTALVAATTYTTVNHGSTTAYGGAVHAHVVSWATTGAWVWRVRHSSNGSAFTDLTTARTLNAATQYQRVEVTGTVKRHLKVVVGTLTTGSAPKVGIAYGRHYS